MERAIRSLGVVLALACIAPMAHAQLTPEQKANAQKTIGHLLDDLKHDTTSNKPPEQLRQMIHANGTPEQQAEYRKLEKNARARTPNDAAALGAESSGRSSASNASSHIPAEGPYAAPNVTRHANQSMEANIAECQARAHPEKDPYCRGLLGGVAP